MYFKRSKTKLSVWDWLRKRVIPWVFMVSNCSKQQVVAFSAIFNGVLQDQKIIAFGNEKLRDLIFSLSALYDIFVINVFISIFLRKHSYADYTHISRTNSSPRQCKQY